MDAAIDQLPMCLVLPMNGTEDGQMIVTKSSTALPRRDKQEMSAAMAANTPTIEPTPATKHMRHAPGDARRVADRADDGRILHKIHAERPAIEILASDPSQER
jgi:hypothetical protein